MIKSDEISGSWPWIAPEVILKEPYDQHVDLWSAGIVLLELLMGKSVMQCDNLMIGELASKNLDWSADELVESLVGDADRGLVLLCKQLLERDPLNRPAAATALRSPLFSGHSSTNLHVIVDKPQLAEFITRTLKMDDEDDTAELLSRALEYDPRTYYFTYKMDSKSRLEFTTALNRGLIKEEIKLRHVQVMEIEGKVIGSMLYMNPGDPRRFSIMAKLNGIGALWKARKGLSVKACIRYQKLMEQEVKKAMTRDSFAIFVIGIDEHYQNRGYGRQFLETTILHWADSQGTCVETFCCDARSVSYFKQFDFQVYHKVEESGLPTTYMLRRPTKLARKSSSKQLTSEEI
jgi:GNAT superfamily N-acetyltransferase